MQTLLITAMVIGGIAANPKPKSAPKGKMAESPTVAEGAILEYIETVSGTAPRIVAQLRKLSRCMRQFVRAGRTCWNRKSIEYTNARDCPR